MRKITLTILVLAALALGLVSCSDKSSEDVGPNGFNAVGTWVCVSSTQGGVTTPIPSGSHRLVFKPDMTWERFYGEELASPGYGTWDYADSKDHYHSFNYSSSGIALLTGWGYGSPKYLPYDPATKELVLDVSFMVERFKKL